MKKIIIVISLIITSRCGPTITKEEPKTKQEQAEMAVKSYLKVRLNDPSSYEPVAFLKLERTDNTIRKNNIYALLKKDSLANRWDAKKYASERTTYDDMYNKIKNEYYSISHTYRAKNGFGAVKKEDKVFALDSNMIVISK